MPYHMVYTRHPCKFTYYNIIACEIFKFSAREMSIFLTFSRFDFLITPLPLQIIFYNKNSRNMPYSLLVPPSYRPNKNRTFGELIGQTPLFVVSLPLYSQIHVTRLYFLLIEVHYHPMHILGLNRAITVQGHLV